MLGHVNEGSCTKTSLMYKACLSYIQLTAYIKLLIRNELIEYNDKKMLYTITNNGKNYLESLEKVFELE